MEDQKRKYFNFLEARETISDRICSKQITNKVYQYSTGSCYDGQWLGGFRHGQGAMKFPDGARYVGQWFYNVAQGKGWFFETDGSVYDGWWANNR